MRRSIALTLLAMLAAAAVASAAAVTDPVDAAAYVAPPDARHLEAASNTADAQAPPPQNIHCRPGCHIEIDVDGFAYCVCD